MDRDEPPFTSKGPSGGSFSSGGASGGGETGLSRLRRERERVDAQRAASKEAKADSFSGQSSHGSADSGGYNRSFERTGRFDRGDSAGQAEAGGSAAAPSSTARDRFSQSASAPSDFGTSASSTDPARVSMRGRRVPIDGSSEDTGGPIRTGGIRGARQDPQAPRERVDFSSAAARRASPEGREGTITARNDGAATASRIERVRPGERDPSWRMEKSDYSPRSDDPATDLERQAPAASTAAPPDVRTSPEGSRLGQNFRSRFAKPPKAYDLDEIGDKGLPLDLLEEGENANFEPANEAAGIPAAGYSQPRAAAKPAEVNRRRSRVDFSSRTTRSREDALPQGRDDGQPTDDFDDYDQQQVQRSRQISPGAYPPPPSPEPQADYYIEDDAVASTPPRPPAAGTSDEAQAFGTDMRDPYQDYAAPAVSAGRQEEFQDYDDLSPVAENAYAHEPHEAFYPDPYDEASDEQFSTSQPQGTEGSFDDLDDLDDFEPLPSYDTTDPQDMEHTEANLDSFPAAAPGPYIDEEFGEPEPVAAGFSDLRADVDASDRGAKPDYSGTFNDFEAKGSRKKPLLLVASLAGVAIIAGGLIFTYQMFSGGGGQSIPVVKLDEAATRVAPDEPGGEEIPHQNKLIYDRIVGEKSTVDEQIVSREEGVIDLNAGTGTDQQTPSETETANGLEIPPAPISPDDADANTSIDNGRDDAIALLQPSSDTSADSAGSVGTPIVPTPTAPEEADTANDAASEASDTVPDLRVETVSPPDPEPVQDTTRPSPPVPRNKPPAPKRTTRVASNNSTSSDTGPIRLTPAPRTADTPAAAPSTAVQSVGVSESAQSAPTPSIPSTAAGTGDYMIQIAAFRSEAEAIAEYQRLRGRHSGLLAGYEPVIQKADLKARGIYYRLRLGPIDGKGRARGLCDSLLAAGETDCLVRTR